MSELETDIYDILSDLESLEKFFNKDYISLKEYYKIKNEILLKYIAIGEFEKSEIMEKLEND